MLVATIQRLPQRTIESIFPNPGTVSPRAAFQTPFGPSNVAVRPLTARRVHPAMVVGLVSGTGVGLVISFDLSTAAVAGLFVGCVLNTTVCAAGLGTSCVLLDALGFADDG